MENLTIDHLMLHIHCDMDDNYAGWQEGSFYRVVYNDDGPYMIVYEPTWVSTLGKKTFMLFSRLTEIAAEVVTEITDEYFQQTGNQLLGICIRAVMIKRNNISYVKYIFEEEFV